MSMNEDLPQKVVRSVGAHAEAYHKNVGTETEPAPACNHAEGATHFQLEERHQLEGSLRPCRACFPSCTDGLGGPNPLISKLLEMPPDALP